MEAMAFIDKWKEKLRRENSENPETPAFGNNRQARKKKDEANSPSLFD
jgi:hypothetical protein